ncbi:MAG: DNA repair protein RadC [Candidatus Hydrogenedentes bacterium]|nr:DNA repair protein RadC [Candidatus Hydrogenedentota bacterium]
MKPAAYSTAVREMPEEERPRERLAHLGAEALRDAELIAVLFRSGTRELGAIALAERLLKEFGDLRAVARASLEELQCVKGLGQVKAIEIKAALELGKRLASHVAEARPRITKADDVSRLLMVRYKDCEREEFKALLLNSKNEVLKIVDVSTGGLDATAVLPRDVFRQAVRDGAVGMIVCHNHPSGDPEPSRDDVTITRRLSDASNVLGIKLLDHVVFGDGRFVSFKERGLM